MKRWFMLIGWLVLLGALILSEYNRTSDSSALTAEVAQLRTKLAEIAADLAKRPSKPAESARQVDGFAAGTLECDVAAIAKEVAAQLSRQPDGATLTRTPETKEASPPHVQATYAEARRLVDNIIGEGLLTQDKLSELEPLLEDLEGTEELKQLQIQLNSALHVGILRSDIIDFHGI